jgi:hypothetical protein
MTHNKNGGGRVNSPALLNAATLLLALCISVAQAESARADEDLVAAANRYQAWCDAQQVCVARSQRCRDRLFARGLNWQDPAFQECDARRDCPVDINQGPPFPLGHSYNCNFHELDGQSVSSFQAAREAQKKIPTEVHGDSYLCISDERHETKLTIDRKKGIVRNTTAGGYCNETFVDGAVGPVMSKEGCAMFALIGSDRTMWKQSVKMLGDRVIYGGEIVDTKEERISQLNTKTGKLTHSWTGGWAQCQEAPHF